MKKITAIILTGVLTMVIGSPVFANNSSNGNHFGWEIGKHNPHNSEATAKNNGNRNGWENGKHNPHLAKVTPPEVDTDITDNTVSEEELKTIVNALNNSELNQISPVNARYENGWIKMDNINFNLVIYDTQMSIVKRVLDNYNVKIVDYAVENVQSEYPGTLRWGTVLIKVDRK
ncbi:hypothetical protein [Bacillus sp. FJAT-45350]|uniref:hypothetical protein n=1 Tax=Bacillus sp. FJAT-45350 TaxID=2011014 RepID=UPI000BB7E299|nr:hypothetical protein [Bacillus sp. FJAT-45350]